MSTSGFRRAVLREAVRLGVAVLPLAVLAALALSYAMLAGGLDAFGRLAVLTLGLPVLIGVPMVVWLALERVRLREARRAVTRAASHDPATGLLNGAPFASMVERRRSPAEGDHGALLIVDASQLGTINRTYGFLWHDEALGHIARAIRDAVRASDLVARIGPDSFGVYLAGAQSRDALEVGERIKSAVSDSYFAPEGTRRMLDVMVAGVVYEGAANFDRLCAQAMETLARPEARYATALSQMHDTPGAGA